MSPAMIAALILQGAATIGKLVDLHNRAKAGETVTKEEVAAAMKTLDNSVDALHEAGEHDREDGT